MHAPYEAVRGQRRAAPCVLPCGALQVWAFGLVLMPVVPLVMVPFLAYHLVSFFVDRANLLRMLEPTPPSSGAAQWLRPARTTQRG